MCDFSNRHDEICIFLRISLAAFVVRTLTYARSVNTQQINLGCGPNEVHIGIGLWRCCVDFKSRECTKKLICAILSFFLSRNLFSSCLLGLFAGLSRACENARLHIAHVTSAEAQKIARPHVPLDLFLFFFIFSYSSSSAAHSLFD